MSDESSRNTPAAGRRSSRGVRVLHFPSAVPAADASAESAPSEHLSTGEQTSALQIAGYVGRILAARGPLQSA